MRQDGQALLDLVGGRRFRTVLADPPWRFTNRTGKMAPEHRRLARYTTMTLDEIAALPVAAVTDEEILAAYRLLASTEGVFCEPASAASVAGLVKRAGEGAFRPGEQVVCVLTGHGLKDPDTAMSLGAGILHVPAELGQVEEALFG